MRTTLRASEAVIFKTKHHWLVLVPAFFWLLAILGLLGGLDYWARDSWLRQREWYLVLAALPPVLWIIWKLLDHYADIWVVTTRRVIDEFGVLSVNSKESPLDKINNIAYRQSLIGRILGYGSIEIQTAAEMGATTYDWVARPQQLKEAITDAQERYKQSQLTNAVIAGSPTEKVALQEDTQECPFCAETIKARAKVCRFCGKDLSATA